ncbi:MAG: YdiU family protein [Planctomycetota bacterium]|nr:YdiU family protein [Planctomycetota bacterium]
MQHDDLNQLTFNNRFVRELPADPQAMNLTRPVHGACFSRVMPTATSAPKLIAHATEVADLIGVSEAAVQSDHFAQVFAGSATLDAMDPFAMTYGGHQFGTWAGQLGDGRAINLGEVVCPDGKVRTLQLKGAGPTPYSRTADGRAVLRSSVREFLCSEAMFHLGVSTTRALSLCLTGDAVMRDMFYDGHPGDEPGAVVCRVSESFVRFGSFELPASRGEVEVLRELADRTIEWHFPHLMQGKSQPDASTYVAMFHEVADSTATMIVDWMRVGFVHGVMNTDNMSILGQTIDYGPYGWLEDFNPAWTPNTTDAGRARYAYGEQPKIGLWNLIKLGNALVPLVEDVDPLSKIVEGYQDLYSAKWRVMMGDKLGLGVLDDEAGTELAQDLLALLSEVETDMTIFFRQLARVPIPAEGTASTWSDLKPLLEAFYDPSQGADETSQDSMERLAGGIDHPGPATPSVPEAHRTNLIAWFQRYAQSARASSLTEEERVQTMDAANPKYVLRNYLAQLAIDKSAEGDHSLVQELLEVLRRPYDEQPNRQAFAAKRPEWARHRPGCSMLSCSS